MCPIMDCNINETFQCFITKSLFIYRLIENWAVEVKGWFTAQIWKEENL